MRLLLAALLLALAPALRATSVIPPSFPELVAEAETIVRGRVTAVTARRVARTDAPGSVIRTYVTLAVERVLKGTAPAEVTLELLGGSLGPDRLVVAGMPSFSLGARELVFIQRNGVQFCPLVGMGHGRYRVQRDDAAARDVVLRDNGVPLRETADVALTLRDLPAPLRAAQAADTRGALTLESFESSIAAELERTGAHAVRD
jgi:hypothetical protein